MGLDERGASFEAAASRPPRDAEERPTGASRSTHDRCALLPDVRRSRFPLTSSTHIATFDAMSTSSAIGPKAEQTGLCNLRRLSWAIAAMATGSSPGGEQQDRRGCKGGTGAQQRLIPCRSSTSWPIFAMSRGRSHKQHQSFGSPFGSHVHVTSEMSKGSNNSSAASTSKRLPVARRRIPPINAGRTAAVVPHRSRWLDDRQRKHIPVWVRRNVQRILVGVRRVVVPGEAHRHRE